MKHLSNSLLSRLYLFLLLFSLIGLLQTKEALAFTPYRCNDPRTIIDPLEPDINNTGLGFFCLVGISYNVFYSAITIVGIGLLLMLIVGGLRYLASGGDEKGLQQARHIITYAVAGMLISVSSIFFMTVIVSRILKPGCDPADTTCTGDPLMLLIPDFFCTVEGNLGWSGSLPPGIKNFCINYKQ